MTTNTYNKTEYMDFTACEALSKIEMKAKSKDRQPLVFICSPYAGTVERNVNRARGYCRYAIMQNVIPIAPHLLFPQFLEADDREDRNTGLFMGMVLLDQCQEIWCFGRMTKGMKITILKACQKGIPIRYFNERCQEQEVSCDACSD